MPISIRERKRLAARRDELIGELRKLPNLMRGTVYVRKRKCGRASCECATGGPRHDGLQLNVTVEGKTVTRYVRQSELANVQALTAAHKRLRALVNELTKVNLELLRGEQVGGARRKG